MTTRYALSAEDFPTTVIPPDTVERSFDATLANAIMNHPEVFAFIATPGTDAIDLSPVISDTNNILLMAVGGAILFLARGPGLYEVHTNFLPGYRGRHAIRASRAAYRWMFTHTPCMTLRTMVPVTNKGADAFCRLVGARYEFTRERLWPTPSGLVDAKFYSLHYHDWMWTVPALAESGKRFHDRLMEERARLQMAREEDHPDDMSHDIAVGACAEMIYGGMPMKAEILYNTWAAFARYGRISLVSTEPAIILNIGDAVLQITGDTFKVLQCR